MNYQETLEYISSISWKGSVPGLSRIHTLLELLGNPQKELKFIHVAGTNGKGSVCAFLSSILEQTGLKVGLFISPYIEVFNERMQINNTNISDGELAEIATYIRPFAESMEDLPTEFELNTAIAFEYFKRNHCDIVVLEVGMGGELDSTNIIDPPEVAVITSIGLDHTQYLGDTVEKIAQTKAGIIKKGTRVALYKQIGTVQEEIRRRCQDVGAELYISEPEKVIAGDVNIDRQVFSYPGIGTMAIRLIGRYQLQNVALVLKVVEILRNMGYSISNGEVVEGLERTKWPGRFEVLNRSPIFIADGSHNPQGISATCESLRTIFKDEKIIFIFGVLADKDYPQMLDMILPLAKEVLTVTPESPRALPAEQLAAIINEKGVSAEAYDSLKAAIDSAFDKAGYRHMICAIGSLYMVGDIRRYVIEERSNGHGRI